jgi:riboflavin biosynthesis pyrimidine reductase
VQSSDGNTVAADPSALGGGETDKHLVYEGLSRVAADAVMAGAETVRDGRVVFSVWHPELVALRQSLGLPRHPTQIVATLRGLQFDGKRLFDEPSLRVILLTVPSCSDVMDDQLARRPWITRVVMPTPNHLRHAFQDLRRLGVERMSCVGGRTLARQLLQAGLIQDVYLTTSPRPGGQPNTPLEIGDADLVVRKHGTDADNGVVFEHTTSAPA